MNKKAYDLKMKIMIMVKRLYLKCSEKWSGGCVKATLRSFFRTRNILFGNNILCSNTN